MTLTPGGFPMSKYTRRFGASAVVAAAMLAACSKADNKVDSTALKTDSTLNRDLALANRDSTAQPQLTDVPATPAATQPQPKVSSPPARVNRPAQSGPTTRPANRPAAQPSTP